MTPTAAPREGSTTASAWVPLWRIIKRIASAIGDSREQEHYARTRLCIRQAALDGGLRIRGRHETESAGRDRTNFSDVYTDIPSTYLKHSVINVLATGATCEGDRHTNPETVYAWGPKGLHETNCYAGLQLNSDDVSRLIGPLRSTGFSSDAPMPETEEWISAASAVALLGMKHFPGTRTICKRAHAGLIKARAERFIRDGKSADKVDVPVEFWWAEGGVALDQNWTTGDFDTWIDERIHLQAFGVTFRRSDIERSKPAPVVENAASSASTPARVFEETRKTTSHDTVKEAESTPDKTTTGEIGTVFISYSHDGPAHVRAVLCLSNRLRSEGIDCVLDQYETSPREGWPQWMDREIKKAQFVLMICTETYYRRVMGQEKPGVGHGVAWESTLIYNHIYNTGSQNIKFIPVIFDEAHALYIPTPMQGATRYCVSIPDGYEQLYNRLIGKPPAEKPPLGKRKALPQRDVKTDFAVLTVSDLALDIAFHVLRTDIIGRPGNFLQFTALRDQFPAVKTRLLEEAVTELEHGGYLTIKATMSQPIACFTPETALYLVFDRAATGRDTSADAVEIAGLWLQDNTMHIIPHLRDRLGWEPRRLNPALCALRYVFPENGWSQLLDPSLVTLRVLIDPSERFQLRRIMESGRIDDTQIAAH